MKEKLIAIAVLVLVGLAPTLAADTITSTGNGYPLYGAPNEWTALEVEFEYDRPTGFAPTPYEGEVSWLALLNPDEPGFGQSFVAPDADLYLLQLGDLEFLWSCMCQPLDNGAWSNQYYWGTGFLTDSPDIQGGRINFADADQSWGIWLDDIGHTPSIGQLSLPAAAKAQAVPEPSTLALLVCAGGMLLHRLARRGQ